MGQKQQPSAERIAMTQSKNILLLSLFLVCLPLYATAENLQAVTVHYPTTDTGTVTTNQDESVDDFFNYSEEEAQPAPRKGFWGRLADNMKKIKDGLKGGYSFVVKPKLKKWWYDQNGKEITIGVGSSVGTMIAMLAAMKARSAYKARAAKKAKQEVELSQNQTANPADGTRRRSKSI